MGNRKRGFTPLEKLEYWDRPRYFRKNKENHHSLTGFTLIELLIVIGVIAVLSVAIILVLDPVELFRQTRDTKRLAQMNSLGKALGIYGVEQSLGLSQTVYISIADPNATTTAGTDCTGVGPSPSTLPPGWKYHCTASSTLQSVNGTGWVPINFKTFSAGSPLSALPIDPINSTTSGYYYSYVADGRFVIASALLESSKFIKLSSAGDGGTDPTRFEVGNSVNLWTQATGLVGYWKFDDGSGSTIADTSGNSNHAFLATPTWTWVTGKVGGAARFNGASCGVSCAAQIANSPSLYASSSISMSLWVVRTSAAGFIYGDYYSTLPFNEHGFAFGTDSDNVQYYHNSASYKALTGLGAVSPLWTHVAVVWNGQTTSLYNNGGLVFSTTSITSIVPETNLGYSIGDRISGGNPVVNATFDELRVYNRALTAAEVSAIYNAAK
ncbi:MAG: LamG-like jellyroll fold domain-containing protein [Patescibacteria group bacterium]